MSDTSSPEQPDAGWYADPSTSGQLRYWSNGAWTAHTQADPSAPTIPAFQAAAVSVAPVAANADTTIRIAVVEHAATSAQSAGSQEIAETPVIEARVVEAVPVDVVPAPTVAAAIQPTPIVTVPASPSPVVYSPVQSLGVLPAAVPSVAAAFVGAEALPAIPATSPLSFDPSPSDVSPPSDPEILGGRRGQRALGADTDEAPIHRRFLVPAIVGGLVVLVALGVWLARSGSSETPTTAASPSASAVETPKAYQTGAAYIDASLKPGDPGALPICAPAAASWVMAPGGTVVTTVVVNGPKSVGVVLIDKTHPERPNASHNSMQLKAGEKSARFTIAVPPGGLSRVQVAIQADQGIQHCDAPKAA